MSLRCCFSLLLFFVANYGFSQDTVNKVLTPAVAQVDSAIVIKDSIKVEAVADSVSAVPAQEEKKNHWAGKAFLIGIILLLIVLALIGIKFGKYKD